VQFGALPAPVDEPPRIVGHVGRLNDEVNWRPKYDLATGMAQTVRYWREKENL
jgi:UDP-glucose 4-epimerase